MKVFVLALCFFALSKEGNCQSNINDVVNSIQLNLLKPAQWQLGERPPKIDLTLVLLASNDSSSAGFNTTTDFMKEILRYYSISLSTTRVSFVIASAVPITVFDFQNYQGRKCIEDAIDLSRPGIGPPNLGAALSEVIQSYESNSSGYRNDSRKFVVIFSNGYNSIAVDSSAVASVLKNTYNAIITVISTGSQDSVPVWNSIATSPSSSFYHVMTDATYFTEFKLRAIKLMKADQCCQKDLSFVYDACGRRCDCINGRFANCCRVRKEYSSMSIEERTLYFQTYITMTTVEPYKTKYETLTLLHKDVFFTGIHSASQFLPWHRWYILQLENILREIDCRVTVPYWAWSLWSHDPWNTINMWNNGPSGLGGDGVPSGNCVLTGQFSLTESNWTIPEPGPVGNGCLSRGFSGSVPDLIQVSFAIAQTNFADFELFLRSNLHDVVHCRINGVMCSLDAAYAPEFFLHHGYVDQIWDEWQKISSANFNAFFPGINGFMEATEYERREFIDNGNLPGCISICYEEPTINDATTVISALRASSMNELAEIERMPSTTMQEAERKLFPLNKAEEIRSLQLQKLSMRGTEYHGNTKLVGRSKVMGFNVEKAISIAHQRKHKI